MANCFYRRIRVPEVIGRGIPAEAIFASPEEALVNHLAEVVVKFCNCRADLGTTDLPGDATNSEMGISDLIAIDTELSDWAQAYIHFQPFHVVSLLEPSDLVLGGYYHTYNSIFGATIWNSYRNIRLGLNSVLKPRLLVLHTKACDEIEAMAIHRQIESCILVLSELASDVCASVPFFFSRARKVDHHLPELSDISGSLLVWPMYAAGIARENVNDPVRVWIAQMLHIIAAATGFEQATRTALILENPDHHHGLW